MRAAKAAGTRKGAKTKIYRIKIISMGDQAVGKSCLIKRYCEDKFVQKYIPTIGVDYGVKPVRLGDYEREIKDVCQFRDSFGVVHWNWVGCELMWSGGGPVVRLLQLRVNLWDLAGADDYIEVRNEFYKDSQGCLLTYDVTNRASFESLQAWLDEAREYGSENMVICVAATKADNPTRKVTEKEGRDWAAGQGVPIFEVSSFSGQAVRSVFMTLFARVLATVPGIPQDLASLAVQSANQAREEEGVA